MSEKCKVLILGEGKNFSGDDKIFEQQKKQLKECRKQKFDTFKEKFSKGLKTIKDVAKGDKKIRIMDNKKM